jgi:AcrR family transcriptional regulator
MMNVRSQARRDRRRDADRRELLAAAERVFTRVGYAAASVRDIASEAGISVGGVYQLVASKDELYIAVLEAVWTDYRAALEPALDRATFAEQLRAFTASWLALFSARRGFLAVLKAEQASFRPAFHDRVQRVILKYKRLRRAQVIALMKQGIAERAIRFGDAEMLASAYLGLVSQCNLDALNSRRPLPSADDLVSLFSHGVSEPAA